MDKSFGLVFGENAQKRKVRRREVPKGDMQERREESKVRRNRFVWVCEDKVVGLKRFMIWLIYCGKFRDLVGLKFKSEMCVSMVGFSRI